MRTAWPAVAWMSACRTRKALPGTLAEVITAAEQTDGVRLGELLAELQPDTEAVEQALAEIIAAAANAANE